MKKWILLTLMLIASSAFAQLDPNPNGVGVYFDQGAMQNCLMDPPLYSQVTAYVIATNISTPGILGWQCSLRTVPAVLPGGIGVTAGCTMTDVLPDMSCTFGSRVGLNDPTIILATLTVLFTGGAIDFAIGPHSVPWLPDTPCFRAGNNFNTVLPLNASSSVPYPGYDNTFIVASINGALCPVPTEPVSWGCLKALYE